MDGRSLMEKMELIAPEFIEAAEQRPCKKEPVRTAWYKWAGLAASIALIIFSGIGLAVHNGDIASPAAVYNSASIFGSGNLYIILLISAMLVAAALTAEIIKGGKRR